MLLRMLCFSVVLALPCAVAQAETYLEVTESRSFRHNEDHSAIIGIVKNIGTVKLEFVEIHALVYDGDGKEIAEDDTYAQRNVLRPGEHSPFLMLLDTDATVASYTFSFSANLRLFVPERIIEIVDADLHASDSLLNEYAVKVPPHVRGTLLNRSDHALENVEVTLAGYNESGQLSAVGFDYVEKLEPGRKTEFRSYLFYSYEPVVFVEVWVSAYD